MLQRSHAGRIVNVMVATPAGGTGQGGIDRVMASLKRELDGRARGDIDVRFLATRGNGNLAHSFLYLSGFCFSMLMARIRKEVDVVHINLASYGSTYRKLVIAICARMLGIPYILHLHGAEYMAFWSDEDTFLNRRIRSMFRQASGIIVLGKVWREFILRKVPEAEKRLVIVPNATEVPSLPREGGGDRVHILFLGRVEKRKGVPELCEALASMADLPGWRATIAGDGEVEKLRLRLTELGLSDRVAVPGWQGPEDVARLLSKADVLTLPSFAENLPISVIEGMAAGLAIVATPVGAVEDIISDGKTGLLVPPGDVGALKRALERLIMEPDLRDRLGDAARAAHRLRLDVAPYADTLRNIWKAAAQTRKIPVEDR
ncbi:glycosyltransferase family 4 protein [Neorhizobium petrolearium]|uniref:glycosyltransferase family 4 protein n=1 Tax=Neorhizobium petrolearium TaxID=515361 RepID=UPI003F17597E